MDGMNIYWKFICFGHYRIISVNFLYEHRHLLSMISYFNDRIISIGSFIIFIIGASQMQNVSFIFTSIKMTTHSKEKKERIRIFILKLQTFYSIKLQ